jgi:putative membrane protein
VPFAIVLVALHVLANVVWVGALLSTALLLAHAPSTDHPAEAATLARRVYAQLAVPAFLASFGLGAVRIVLSPQIYAHMGWMHAKLTLAFVFIALHHVIGARARRAAAGNAAAARGVAVLGLAAFLCAAGAVMLGVAKSFP